MDIYIYTQYIYIYMYVCMGIFHMISPTKSIWACLNMLDFFNRENANRYNWLVNFTKSGDSNRLYSFGGQTKNGHVNHYCSDLATHVIWGVTGSEGKT